MSPEPGTGDFILHTAGKEETGVSGRAAGRSHLPGNLFPLPAGDPDQDVAVAGAVELAEVDGLPCAEREAPADDRDDDG